MGNFNNSFPPLQLPFSKKNKKWRKLCVDWGDSKTFFNYNLVRKSVIHKRIAYDLLNGKLHMNDLLLVLNPENILAGFIPERIQHYPIMNSKLNILKGEESKRVFDYRIVVTNPNAISEIENNKKAELLLRLLEWVSNNSLSEEQANQELLKISDYFTYEWQDMREVRANALVNHYSKEYDIPSIFNDGFMDAMAVGEEIYQCDIRGGEPTLEKLNPLKLRIFKSGYSNRIEDADMIIIEDYWSPGKVIDVYGEILTPKDMKYLQEMPDHIGLSAVDSMDNIDERYGFVNNSMIGDEITSLDGFFWDPFGASDGISNSLLPYDMVGNIRVLRVYWKSRRKIKRVKSYDPETGEEIFSFRDETYIIDKDRGEEEHTFWINEAWEGTKIGTDIYVNMRPRVVLYNRLSNPSRCHFGIVGTIYNINETRPFSMVDMMKPYNYLYDIMHDRLNKLLAKNWGKIALIDLAKVPKGWDMEKWIYFAKTLGVAIIDSFKEGNIGASTGKLAGALNNASNGVIDLELSNSIQFYINFLEFIKMEMSEVVGITKQREGLISNRETVGGVERATLLSSHITEWLFTKHENTKKRVLEAFLETAKIALKGRSKKFKYILPDTSQMIIDIDGDEFAEADYGLVVDNSNNAQELNNKLDTLAQAALQNQLISFSTMMKLYNSSSLAEKLRMVERDEQLILLRQQQQQQAEIQARQEEVLALLQQKQLELELKDLINQRDNETKILIALMLANNSSDAQSNDEDSKALLLENIRLFDLKLRLERDKFEFDKIKTKRDLELKEKLINKMHKTTNNK